MLRRGNLHDKISSLLSLDRWLSATTPSLSADVSPFAPSVPSSSRPMPKSMGLRPARLAMFGSACTSSIWETMLLFPILAAMLSAVSPAWSWMLTTSVMKRPMPILRPFWDCELCGASPLPLAAAFCALGTLPCRTTHSSRLSR